MDDNVPKKKRVASSRLTSSNSLEVNKPPKPPKSPKPLNKEKSKKNDISYDDLYPNPENNELLSFNNQDSSVVERKKERPVSTARPKSKKYNPTKLEEGLPPIEIESPKKDRTDKNAKSEKDIANAEYKKRFGKGLNQVEYGLWGNYMSYGSAMFCLISGLISILWAKEGRIYGCKIDNEFIHSNFLNNTCDDSAKYNGVCVTCNPLSQTVSITDSNRIDIHGNELIGLIYVSYSILILLIENNKWGFGLWYPSDSLMYKYGLSPLGFLHIGMGIYGCTSISTLLAGVCLIVNGLVYFKASYRGECGDGGRNRARLGKPEQFWSDFCIELPGSICTLLKSPFQFNIFTFLKRIYQEDKISSYFWILIFFAGNAFYFYYQMNKWNDIVSLVQDQLLDGTLDVSCDDNSCAANRKMVQFGPISEYAPYSKAFGGCLNLDCALLLLPVIRSLLQKLNNIGVSFSSMQNSNSFFAKCFARPLTRYIPLSKNIDFHKIVGCTICFMVTFHAIFHCINLTYSYSATIQTFGYWAFATGVICTFSMFMIFSGASDAVKNAKYEIFFKSHHFFAVFFIALLFHGPKFLYWGAIPILLYVLEKIMQTRRGNLPFIVTKVEWIKPVMAVYFRPVFKDDFKFTEGQYMYLQCPHISNQWHPFTISSAYDDLHDGPRVHLETGEEVIEVPRPANAPPGSKWSKYCLVSQDYRKLAHHELLDKGDTCYNDFVSAHIKVHGLDDEVARSWTRKLKEYFEELSGNGKFPIYFKRKDQRGDISIGLQNGIIDGQQILKVDGPHSAPSEHYKNYDTVMVIGAGIGCTPCASILCSLLKYQWRKDAKPEILHFYWVVRQADVDSFQWFIHMLTEISYDLKKSRESNFIAKRYYCEINIYITACDKNPVKVEPMQRSSKLHAGGYQKTVPSFTADDLHTLMLNPPLESGSKGQIKKMKSKSPPNRLGDIWVWNGRPNWDEVFCEVAQERQHSDIGVCFCGTPVIGADLKSMCEKYSDAEKDCLFSLHKENF